ncbi:Phage tail assembly chaperone protein [uncultured Caudovirales phage]|uniref:Phage tail assembly chaperone protein n=1 Tax=uncultured Caudovirales phage TaxID=2100421 RepID=A0A6J5MT50_9CAUD|nr:Phage tail assembly chaperone protein [uncultured Caudovirales phage]CAB4150345.1 Phage tail assembly chaperone protein [uncultured Caudovirales phage]
MKNFTIYKANGEITRSGQCLEIDIAQQQYDKNTEQLIELFSVYGQHYIDNNIAVKIPPSPNEYSVFNYDTKQWVDPRTNETQWVVVRNEREKLLFASDWTQLPDVGIITKTAWATYRQELRDITTQSDPFNIVWPSKPE